MVHVTIDCRTIEEDKAGVGYYTLHLVREFRALSCGHEFTFLASKKNEAYLCEQIGECNGSASLLRASMTHENHPLVDVWENTVLPLRLLHRRVRVFHSPAFLSPWLKMGVRTVVTIPDLIPMLFPKEVPSPYGLYMRRVVPMTAKRADRIIVFSESTKGDLLSRCDARPEKIAVIPLAAGPMFRPVEDPDRIAEVRRKYGITKKYILYLGNVQPLKNLPRLFTAFKMIRDKLRGECQIVVGGKKRWFQQRVNNAVKGYQLDEDVLFTGYVDEGDAPALYTGAEIFVFPSLYEGFGMPLVEAMSCGVPVVTSNVSSIPEVVGDAALLVNPCDEIELAEAMFTLLTNGPLRRKMREAGLGRARLFSWRRTAERTLAVYDSVG
jgi:glycosyltransferase involved in cell wall biosynthesis